MLSLFFVLLIDDGVEVILAGGLGKLHSDWHQHDAHGPGIAGADLEFGQPHGTCGADLDGRYEAGGMVPNSVVGGEIVMMDAQSEAQVLFGCLDANFGLLLPCFSLQNPEVQVATYHVSAGQSHLTPTACLL